MAKKQVDTDLLRRMAEFEDGLDPQTSESKFKAKAGWQFSDVGVYPSSLVRLRIEGLIEDGYQSNSYHGYRLTEKARAMLVEGSPDSDRSQQQAPEIPADLFDDIIGHQDEKDLLSACLSAEKPVHVLLAGPPALAKSLFLWDIERIAGDRALWLVGSATSKAGLWDIVADRQPLYLLIDELDKMSAADTAALLSMMEGGRLVRAKKGRELELEREIRVIAACNRTRCLSPELLSRFAVRFIEAYSRSDFLQVVRGVLVKREGVSWEAAAEIARSLDGRTQDVRDAIRVSRLAPSMGIERTINLLLGEG